VRKWVAFRKADRSSTNSSRRFPLHALRCAQGTHRSNQERGRRALASKPRVPVLQRVSRRRGEPGMEWLVVCHVRVVCGSFSAGRHSFLRKPALWRRLRGDQARLGRAWAGTAARIPQRDLRVGRRCGRSPPVSHPTASSPPIGRPRDFASLGAVPVTRSQRVGRLAIQRGQNVRPSATPARKPCFSHAAQASRGRPLTSKRTISVSLSIARGRF